MGAAAGAAFAACMASCISMMFALISFICIAFIACAAGGLDDGLAVLEAEDDLEDFFAGDGERSRAPWGAGPDFVSFGQSSVSNHFFITNLGPFKTTLGRESGGIS